MPKRANLAEKRKLWGVFSAVLCGLFLGLPQGFMSDQVPSLETLIEQMVPAATQYITNYSNISSLNGCLASISVYLLARIKKVKTPSLAVSFAFLIADLLGSNISVTHALMTFALIMLVVLAVHRRLRFKNWKMKLDHYF